MLPAGLEAVSVLGRVAAGTGVRAVVSGAAGTGVKVAAAAAAETQQLHGVLGLVAVEAVTSYTCTVGRPQTLDCW